MVGKARFISAVIHKTLIEAMARIRSVKPEIVADSKLSSVSRDARLTFIYAITQADDIGLLAGAPRQLVGTLYPLDESVTAPMLRTWIDELVSIGLVRIRETRDGVPVLQIKNWSKHQRIDNAGRSQLGALLAESPDDPPQSAATRGDPTRPGPPIDALRDPPRAAATRGLDLLPPTKDLGPPTKDLGPTTTARDAAVVLAVAANRGLLEHPDKPQRIPRIHATQGRTLEAAERILSAGVPLAFAESAVYEFARSNTADGEVKSLGYFVDAVVRRWNEAQEEARIGNSSPPTTRNGRRRPVAHNGGDRNDAAIDRWLAADSSPLSDTPDGQ